MKARKNMAVLVGGTVADVRFSPEKGKAYVEFENEGNFVFEFGNNRRPLADHIRKMRLQKGEKVVAIGRFGGSEVYGFGFDVKRSGEVGEGEYSLLRGTVDRIVKAGSRTVVVLRSDDGKTFTTSAPKNVVSNLSEGNVTTFKCVTKKMTECETLCSNFSRAKCSACKKNRPQKRYEVIEVG